jgi:hypothetical protein
MRKPLLFLGSIALGLGFLETYPVGAGEKDKELPPVNEKVLKYAEAQLGKQVGNGECWTLADEALAAAEAKRPGRGGYGIYVFGRELKADEAPLPGDIVQFYQAKFVSKNGAWSEMYQHTAVITEVKGGKIEVLHQNYNNVRKVGRWRFDPKELTKGKMLFFRPEAAQ